MEPTVIIDNIVDCLFPSHPVRQDDVETMMEEIPLFTAEEIATAVKGLENGKAPGLDGVLEEALKAIALTCPQVLLNTCSACMEEGVFPSSGKRNDWYSSVRAKVTLSLLN